jgi:hypothetical protein
MNFFGSELFTVADGVKPWPLGQEEVGIDG